MYYQYFSVSGKEASSCMQIKIPHVNTLIMRVFLVHKSLFTLKDNIVFLT